MDKVQDCEDLTSLSKLADEYDRQMKMVGIDLSDLPEDCASLLSEYAEAKLKTKLADVSMSFLDEFYYTNMMKYLEHKYDKFRMESDIKDLEEQIEQEKKATKILEDFIESIKKRMDTDEELERKKFMVEKQIESLIEKQNSYYKPPADFNLEELIAKAELLKSKMKPSKQK